MTATYTLFSDNAQTTAASYNGGAAQADAPNSGTTQTWTVASSSSFPAIGAGQIFNVIDPAQPTEVITVTAVSGTSWTVTRGGDSTTPTRHGVGAVLIQTVSAGDLGSFIQNNQTSTFTLNAPLSLAAQGSTPSPVSNNSIFYANANGTPSAETPAGLAGSLAITQTDTASYNTTSTSVTAITKAWSIPSGDMQVNTNYTIRFHGTGTWAGINCAIHLMMFGTDLNIMPNNFPSGWMSSGHGFHYDGFVSATVLTVNSSTGVLVISGYISGQDVTSAATPNPNPIMLSGNAAGKQWTGVNTVSSTTMAVGFQFGASPSFGLTTYFSEFTRTGP